MASHRAKSSAGNTLECSICTETFKTPKSLPCIHTFCLECLEKYGKFERLGDEMPCPLCRQLFKIPAEGFKKLPNNIFINQILASGKQLTVGSSSNEMQCEGCNKTEATKYCVDCTQSMCDVCSVTHGNLKLAQSHQVVSLTDKEGYQVYTRARPAYCDTHKGKQLELYCYDCSEAICLMCSVVDHKPHHYEDIQRSSNKFSEELKDGCSQLNQVIKNCASEQKSLDTNKRSLLDHVSACKRAINERGIELKRLVDEQCSELFSKLEEFMNEEDVKIQRRKNEVERQLSRSSNLRAYVEELVEKGSACAISQSGKGLLDKAKQLCTDQIEFSKSSSSTHQIKFESANITDITSGRMALIGSLTGSEAFLSTCAGFRPNIKIDPADTCTKIASPLKFKPVFAPLAKKQGNQTPPASAEISLECDNDTDDTSVNAKKPRLTAEKERPAQKLPHHQVRDYLKCCLCQKPRCFYAEKSLKQDQRQLWVAEKERLKDVYTCGDVALFSREHALASVVYAEAGVQCASPVSIHYYGRAVNFPSVCYACGASCSPPDQDVARQFLSYHPVCDICRMNGKPPRTRNKTKKQDQAPDVSD